MNRSLNPASVAAPKGAYSHGVEVPPGARIVFVAGQGGFDRDGVLADSLTAQTEQALANVLAIIEDAGMYASDIVKMTTYIVSDLTGPELMAPIAGVFAKHLGDARPSSTAVIVKGFAVPEMLIEIEAIAAKPG